MSNFKRHVSDQQGVTCLCLIAMIVQEKQLKLMYKRSSSEFQLKHNCPSNENIFFFRRKGEVTLGKISMPMKRRLQ